MSDLRSFHPAVVQPVERQQTSEAAGTQAMSIPFTVTASNLLVVVAVIVSMWIGGYDVAVAVRWMLAYFAISTVVFVISANGSLTEMFRIYQIERTERERIDAHAGVLEAWIKAQQAQPAQRPERIERVSPLSTTYVPPYAPGAQEEAIVWLGELYRADGLPDPKKVNADGRLRVRMLGSKRGGGSRDAGIWLIRQGLIRRVEGGYSLNVTAFPSRDSLSRFR